MLREREGGEKYKRGDGGKMDIVRERERDLGWGGRRRRMGRGGGIGIARLK